MNDLTTFYPKQDFSSCTFKQSMYTFILFGDLKSLLEKNPTSRAHEDMFKTHCRNYRTRWACWRRTRRWRCAAAFPGRSPRRPRSCPRPREAEHRSARLRWRGHSCAHVAGAAARSWRGRLRARGGGGCRFWRGNQAGTAGEGRGHQSSAPLEGRPWVGGVACHSHIVYPARCRLRSAACYSPGRPPA